MIQRALAGTDPLSEPVARPITPVIDGAMLLPKQSSMAPLDCPRRDPAKLKTAECRQTIAAEQSADAAAISNQMAIASAILSLVGLIAILASLWQTRKALRLAREEYESSRTDAEAANTHTTAALGVAKDSAAAATRLAVTTEHHGRLRIRPYLCIDPGDGTVVIGRPAAIGFKIINRGDTPAVNIRCLAALRVDRPGYAWPPVSLDEIIPAGEMPSMILAKGQQLMALAEAPAALTEAQYDKIKAGELVVYAQQIVQYETMFGDKCETVAALEFSGAECFRISRPRISARGNRLT